MTDDDDFINAGVSHGLIYVLLPAVDALLQQLIKEIETVVPNGPVQFQHLAKLKHCHDIFREALRLYPPVGFFMRQTLAPEQLRDKSLPTGAAVLVSPWLLHRHRRLWRDPDHCDPGRFRDGSCSEAIKTAYMPFGSGQRICIGAGFATQEALLILAEFLRRYHLATIPGLVPEPVGRVTIRPLRGVHLHLTRRAQQTSSPTTSANTADNGTRKDSTKESDSTDNLQAMINSSSSACPFRHWWRRPTSR